MKQVFAKNPVNLNENFCLDEKQAHHIFDVLRSSPKETIRLVHEDEIYLAHPQEKPFLYVFGVEKADLRLVDVTLCAALIKQDKWELMLQKVAELGVSRIVPFECKNTVVKIDEKKLSKKYDRWSTILEEACKQCNRADYVVLEPISSLKGLADYKSQCNLVAYEKEDGSNHISACLMDNPSSVTVVIGPEGGFEPKEIEVLESLGFVPCSLGSQILRAETASMYVLSVIEYQSHLKPANDQA